MALDISRICAADCPEMSAESTSKLMWRFARPDFSKSRLICSARMSPSIEAQAQIIDRKKNKKTLRIDFLMSFLSISFILCFYPIIPCGGLEYFDRGVIFLVKIC